MDSARNLFADPVACPDCGDEVRVGLPRSATIEAVTRSQSADLDDSYTGAEDLRKKRRQSCCPNGHVFYIYFEF